MDWAANLLGLSSAFSHASGVGGGVIQVCRIFLIQTSRLYFSSLDISFRLSDRGGCRCSHLVPEEPSGNKSGGLGYLYNYSNTLCGVESSPDIGPSASIH